MNVLYANLSNQSLNLPRKKSFKFAQASFMDIALAENGHFTSKIAGDAVSLLWRWTFILHVLGSPWTNPSGEAPRTPDSWSQIPLIESKIKCFINCIIN